MSPMIASHYLVIIKKTASHYNCKSLARKKKKLTSTTSTSQKGSAKNASKNTR
jgi:hypothetical protein